MWLHRQQLRRRPGESPGSKRRGFGELKLVLQNLRTQGRSWNFGFWFRFLVPITESRQVSTSREFGGALKSEKAGVVHFRPGE